MESVILEEGGGERPATMLSPAAIEQIRAELARAPQQEYRGGTPVPTGMSIMTTPAPRLMVEATPTPGFGTSMLYAGDALRLATPAGTLSQPGTVAMYQGDAARRGVVTRTRPSLGDKKIILQGYKANSLCNTLIHDAMQRIYAALQLLDPVHAGIIQARVAKAGLKNSNASHADVKGITFKKAVSIALQAERWVYQAQAAAAKSMVKESKQCLHNLAGKRKRSTEEKEAAYSARYGVPRGTRKERAIRKKQKQIERLTA